MNRRAGQRVPPAQRRPLWTVSITTSVEAEDAVAELLSAAFGRPVASYHDLEAGQTTVTAYLESGPGSESAGRTDASTRGRFGRVNRAWTGTSKIQQAGPARALDVGCWMLDVGCSQASLREDLRRRLRAIQNCGLNTSPARISLARVPWEDWAESWKRHFKPISIGSSLLVKPSWSRRQPRKGQALVVLDPGLSFGTGQHPTTAFCLQQIVRRRRPGTAQSFLDIGTGSGILAIAAARLGYAPVHAFDLDPDSIRVARTNARHNRLTGRIRFTRQDLSNVPVCRPRKYFLVCANLISTLLLSERQRLLACLAPSGVLVLAGILADEFAEVQAAYEAAGLRLIASRRQREWWSGAFVKAR
ncbi:MAG TPA: 50S ribosomal protein L11 methyltransferase [Candidatus Acidoferrum sp.]|nr:50S ribosomal protein L11 methyltransferase [Candidatus Acidoferrum sp.]